MLTYLNCQFRMIFTAFYILFLWLIQGCNRIRNMRVVRWDQVCSLYSGLSNCPQVFTTITHLGIFILVNQQFLDLDPEWQNCIMTHEEGHVVLGHLNGYSPWRASGSYLSRDISLEIEADAYMCQHCDDESRQFLLAFLTSIARTMRFRGFDERIDALTRPGDFSYL